ncbi:MAG: response regulator [Planctomycetota bacterium]|jgi:DNA-binding NarL/FixJ family response regulator
MNEKKEQYEKNEGKTRILIVDDHPVVRQGLIQLINHEPDLVVSAEAENAAQALEVLEKESVDIAIVDISLNGTNGIQLTEKIKSKYPDLPVLILTIHDEAVYAKHTLEAGAKGYVNKREAAETIITAIRLVISGNEYISEKRAGDVLKALRTNGSHC